MVDPHVIDEGQGSVKMSEVAMDDAIAIIGTAERQASHTTMVQFANIITDALKKQAFILFSRGEILWNDTAGSVDFNNGSAPSDIILRMLQWEDSNRIVDLVLTGGTSDTATTFFQLPISSGEVFYLDINRDLLKAAGNPVVVQNGVNGGATTGAVVLRKAVLGSASGIPALYSSIDGNTTTTAIVPLAMRDDYTYNSVNYSDLLWIPHGIRWPKATMSMIGAVVVSGFDALPNYFVSTKAQLVAALTALQTIGGMVCITGPITLDSSITVYPNVQLTARSWLQAPITVTVGGSINVQTRGELKNLNLVASSYFGTGSAESIVSIAAGVKRARVTDCQFTLQNTAGDSTCISVSGDQTRINNCTFVGVDAEPAYRTGVNYVTGSNNVDCDSIYE